MAFHDTTCACGGRKPTDTMLCATCTTHAAQTPEMAIFNDPQTPTQGRRSAAIRLLAMARRRPLLKLARAS